MGEWGHRVMGEKRWPPHPPSADSMNGVRRAARRCGAPGALRARHPSRTGRSAPALDHLVSREGVPRTLGSLKRAEDGDGLILRLFEPHGNRGPATLRFALPVERIERGDLFDCGTASLNDCLTGKRARTKLAAPRVPMSSALKPASLATTAWRPGRSSAPAPPNQCSGTCSTRFQSWSWDVSPSIDPIRVKESARRSCAIPCCVSSRPPTSSGSRPSWSTRFQKRPGGFTSLMGSWSRRFNR